MGAEIQSGDNTAIQNTIDHNFVPLYGVAWKFMGNMNFFTRFPADVGNSGLINPYLFLIYKISSKVSLRADEHLFYSQFGLLDKQKNTVNRYLGFENDFVLNYKHSERFDMHLGISYYLPTESMNLLKKIESPNQIPVWIYLMISYKPISLVFKNRNKA